MTVNLESTLGVEASRLRADRRNAGARQDRWMLEFEKAFTPAGDAGGDAGTGGAPAAGAAPARMPAPGAARAAAAPAPRAAPSHGAAHTAPSQPAPHAARAGARDAAVQGEAGAQRRADAPAVDTGRQDAASESDAVSGAGAAASVGVAGAAVPEGAGADLLRGEARIAPGLFLSAMPRLGLAAQQAAPYGAPALREGAAGEAGRPPAGTPFDARAMHLFVDGEGVHAYIRDAALQAAGLRSVAQALTAEMAAAGQQLATLTINGKGVAPRAAHPNHDEDDAFLQPHSGGEAAPSLRYPFQPVSEGNS
jgi:hypothetical protein